MSTYHELKTKAEMLLKEAEELRKKEVPEVIRDIKEKMKEYGITTEDLESSDKKTASKDRANFKYRNSNGQGWSGRGRAPAWIVEAEKSGRSREEFAVDHTTNISAQHSQ